MADEPSQAEQGQIERAQRLRQQIERLKKGRPKDKSSEHDKSLREQIEERAAEQKKSTEDE